MIYLDYYKAINSSSAPSGSPVAAMTFINQTPLVNTVSAQSSLKSDSVTPIGAGDTISWTIDYITDGVALSPTVITGNYGATISAGDISNVQTNTGITITGGTYDNFQYEHPDIPNQSPFPFGTYVAPIRGIVRKAEFSLVVSEGGANPSVNSEVDWSSYIQVSYENGNTAGGSNVYLRKTPAGEVGRVGATYGADTIQGTQELNGEDISPEYDAWLLANSGTPTATEYSKGGAHAFINPTIFVNGVEMTPTGLSGTIPNSDADWRQTIEYAFEQIDGVPVGPLGSYVMSVEQKSFGTSGSDRLGNADDSIVTNVHTGLSSAQSDWGGVACSCWTSAKNHLNATGDAIPAGVGLGEIRVDTPDLGGSTQRLYMTPYKFFR